MLKKNNMYCEFTKNLIFHDFDDVLKDPFRNVHLFLLLTLLLEKISKIAKHDLQQRVQSCDATPSSSSKGLALTKCRFSPTTSTYQKHLKLGQCLEIGDRRSFSKFGDNT